MSLSELHGMYTNWSDYIALKFPNRKIIQCSYGPKKLWDDSIM